MPELPEVETIKRDLERYILHKKIKGVVIKEPRSIKEPGPAAFKKKIEGQSIKEIKRRGKVLVLSLTSKEFLVVHLRLTGWFSWDKKADKSARVIFLFSDGFLNFCDPRLFGELRLIKDWQNLPMIKKMGPEPLEISKFEFIQMFKTKRAKIKPLLMEQSFLAGIGNLYAAEGLFCAAIHPQRGVYKITSEELGRLYDCLKGILSVAIKNRGTSVDTFRDLKGKEGGFSSYLKVYGRKNQPCFKCRTPIKRITLGGRGTYFCSQCQH